jgi:hypothetical protein
MSEVAPPSARRVSQYALIFALFALGIWTVRDFLPALAWAAVVAIAIWPLYERAKWRPRNRTAAAALITLLIGLVLIAPLIALGVEIGRVAVAAAQWMRTAERDGVPVPDWLSHVPLLGTYLTDWWQNTLAEPGSAAQMLGRVDRNLLIEWTRIVGVQVLRRLTILVFTFLTLFFLFRDGESLVRQTSVVLDRMFGPTGVRLLPRVMSAVRATVNGLVLVLRRRHFARPGLCARRFAAFGAARSDHGRACNRAVRSAGRILRWRARSPQPGTDRGCCRIGRVRGCRRVRGGSFRAPDVDRRRRPVAVPLGPDRHIRWIGDVRDSRPVSRANHHRSAAGTLARMGEARAD